MNYRKIFLIMARIIYKEGLEGQNRLECIEGIEINLLNGQKALIYPKYRNEELLDPKDRDRWLDAGISETAALRLRDNQAATAALLEAKSPAARFVTKFTSERFGRFGLPALLAAMEITEQEGEIDKLAREIDGADLLEDFSSSVWSCSRFSPSSEWIADDKYGCACGGYLGSRFVAVPLVLLDEKDKSIMENKELNLCEILKDCPKGTKLYTPLYGVCSLYSVDDKFVTVNYVGTANIICNKTFFPNGAISELGDECLLFPSKDNRDWSTFKTKK